LPCIIRGGLCETLFASPKSNKLTGNGCAHGWRAQPSVEADRAEGIVCQPRGASGLTRFSGRCGSPVHRPYVFHARPTGCGPAPPTTTATPRGAAAATRRGRRCQRCLHLAPVALLVISVAFAASSSTDHVSDPALLRAPVGVLNRVMPNWECLCCGQSFDGSLFSHHLECQERASAADSDQVQELKNRLVDACVICHAQTDLVRHAAACAEPSLCREALSFQSEGIGVDI
jgi:hypothetical protein